MSPEPNREWFTEWFNEDYLALYSHRNEGEARSVADLIRARVPAQSCGRTLDLGCGAGRHLPYLRAQQLTVGLDLSPWLLDVARQKHPPTPLVRADMRRLPFQDGSFTLVVNLFTSFGYFIEDSQNKHVLRETARVTRPGGYLVLDFLNAPHTRQTIVPFERRQVGSEWVQQRREVSEDGRFILKTIMIGTPAKVFSERVRLFEPADLEAMLADCGFIVTGVCGDYAGGPLTGTSPRAIIVARLS
jgi:SAM-dependent methyltransferase